MPYTALPDRRMPYDNDGSSVGYSSAGDNQSSAIVFAWGVAAWLTGSTLVDANDNDYSDLGLLSTSNNSTRRAIWFFFPEQREVTGVMCLSADSQSGNGFVWNSADTSGSNDSTNGVDGTWESASIVGAGYAQNFALDDWRDQIAAVSFTGPKRVFRIMIFNSGSGDRVRPAGWHIYGEKAAGQTPDDIVFINHDDTPGVEYTAPEDFGDQPLGTTVVRQFRLKNVSGTKTANTINIQCNDTDFAISEDGVNWVVTINIASLSAGAESATLYVRCTTPAVGSLIGPRFARIVATVGSYT